MKDLNAVKEIYHEAFGTFPGFDEAFFAAFGDRAETFTVNGAVVSVLFLLPCLCEGRELYYLYAAATKKSERGKGYMKRLIAKTLEKTAAPVFLMPAEAGLVSFYEKCGFYPARGVRENGDVIITVTKEHEQLSRLCDDCPREFTLMFSKKREDKTFRFPYVML